MRPKGWAALLMALGIAGSARAASSDDDPTVGSDPASQPAEVKWDLRLAIVPIKLNLRQPDYHGINRFNRALGIAPFTQQTLVTYGSEVGVYVGEQVLLSLGVERGSLRKAGRREGIYREISMEMERSDFRIEFLSRFDRLEGSAGLFGALGVITLRSKLQPTSGGASTRPIGTLDANFLMAGPRLAAGWWVNPHLNLSLNLAYTLSTQYNRPPPDPDGSDVERQIRTLEYSDVHLGLATTVKF